MAINVVNKYKHKPTPNDVYIGRGSIFGNPFVGSKDVTKTKGKFQCADRDEACAKHKTYLREEIANGNQELIEGINILCEASKLGDINLVCFCAPLACHGNNIKELCEEILNKTI